MSTDCAACFETWIEDERSAAARASPACDQRLSMLRCSSSFASAAAELTPATVSKGHVVILSDDDDDDDDADVVDDDEGDSDDDDDEDDGDAADDHDHDHEYDDRSDQDDHDADSRSYAHLNHEDRTYFAHDHDDTLDRRCGDERADNVSLDALLLQYRIQQQHHLSLTYPTHASILPQQQQNVLSAQALPHHFKGCIIV